MDTTMGDAWVRLLGADPRPWLLASAEPPARWVSLARLEGRAEDDPEVLAARAVAVTSPMVADLIDALPGWGHGPGATGHDSPSYLPNLLAFLADLGVRAGDDPRVDDALDAIGSHQEGDGRIAAFGRARGHPEPLWGSLPCDTHRIAEVLLRYGRAGDPVVVRALGRIAADRRTTNQGTAWTCIPDPVVGFRGPGRKGDICPQVTLEALRAFSWLPEGDRPEGLDAAARTVLDVWRDRGAHQPYMFGHGLRFKTVKWPPLWYGAYAVLDTLGRYPALWRDGERADRRSLAELVACVVAYNVAPDGTVTPRSVYRGFTQHSFGQKKQPSPIATALLAAVVRPFADLADDIAEVDVATLTSSKGGTGTPAPPRR
jgi:hypothetical protein